MIHFVTDVQRGEPDILTGVKHEMLRVSSLLGECVLTLNAPEGGWTHQKLTDLSAQLPDSGEAHLGAQWIGGSEV